LRCPPYADAAELAAPQGGSGETPLLHSAAAAGCAWLLDLQNSDGGIPTFCRGWGRLPFDRSSQDLTAHALAAWSAWLDDLPAALAARTRGGIRAGVRFLLHAQGADGQWTPLWFGHEDAPAQANPVYGTARVLLALTDLANPGWHGHLARRGERPARGESRNPPRRVTHGRDAHATPGGPTCFDGLGQAIAKGAAFLLAARGEGGGWGGAAGTPPSIEETALAVDALAATLDWATATATTMASPPAEDLRRAVAGGAAWLVEHTRGGTEFSPAPIGLYFAKLWYFERLYPIIFTVSALRRAVSVLCDEAQ
jgi:squalene-hopene/tetraprenyl-beta-curcumene cyclase